MHTELLAEYGGISFGETTVEPDPRCAGCSEIIRLRSEVGYWRAMHAKAKEKAERLSQENEALQSKLRLRERQLFSRRSERKGKGQRESGPGAEQEEKRKRGQQPGAVGHGRRLHEHLPAVEEQWDFPEGEQQCPHCGLPFRELPGTEDSEEVVVEVKAHRRVIKRKRYKPVCKCPGNPGIITAPGPAKLIPKGGLHLSFFVMVLLDKFLFQRPTYRLLTELWVTQDLRISQGTVTGGLKRLAPLFEPLYEMLIKKNVSEALWHADETRWLVFEEVSGKQGYRWYLWVFRSPSTVVYVLDPSRSASVPEGHFGKDAEGIVVVDRYSAYKAMVLVKEGKLILAFCWAHVRRDFLGVAKDWPKLHEAWGLSWVEKIAKLYRLNRKRLLVQGEPGPFAEADAVLRRAVDQMAEDWHAELDDTDLHPARRKVLESMEAHWSGLTVFVDHPEVAMDNNEAERKIRNPAVGRKDYYGSGSKWSGKLAAMLFSLFQTLLLWHINPKRWLTDYLECCAQNQGQPPENVASFLPWNLSDEQMKKYQMQKGNIEERDTS